MKKLGILIVCTVLLGSFRLTADEPIADTEMVITQSEVCYDSGHFVYLMGGVGHIISKVSVDYVSGEPRIGGIVAFGYDWLSSKKLGAGFLYNGYYTNFSNIVYDGYHNEKLTENWSLHYFAPQCVGRTQLKTSRWSLRYAIGFGLVMSKETVKTKEKRFGVNYDFGYGTNLTFGAEFWVAKKVAVIGSLNLFQAYVKQSYFGESENSSLIRIDLTIGAAYHF